MTDYEILPFPSERNLVVDAGYLGARRHLIYGFVELDVTDARRLIEEASSKLGRKVSFTAFLAACLAQAIQEEPRVQAYRDWRGRLVVFHEVDVVVMIEAQSGGVAIPHMIRCANRKSVLQISDEIRSIQADPQKSEQHGGFVSLAPKIPRWLRMFFFWALKKNPHWFKQMEGTTILTSVGMFGKGGGWGLTFLPVHTLGITVGGIAQKPGVHQGAIAIREYLNLTASFDHDIVDGAPAARLLRKLGDLIQDAALLKN
jgi:pyruvate/2-oxoglutarate dehydrogenase complex dihydrolipoamide acyltransferase (E2) component